MIGQDSNCLDDLRGCGDIQECEAAESLPNGVAAFLNHWAIDAIKRSRKTCATERSPQHHHVYDDARVVAEPLKKIEKLVRASEDCALDASEGGPLKAVKRLREKSWDAQETALWVVQARASALAGSCPRSHPSVLSGLRCYVAFAQTVMHLSGHEFPPTVDTLLAWSALFRCSRTFGNYLNYVRLGCELIGSSTVSLDSRALVRAKLAIAKRRQFVARKKMFLRLSCVKQMLHVTRQEGHPKYRLEVMMYLTCYVFLLRLPSECLPIVVDGVGVRDGEQAVISVTDDKLILHLARRKNKPEGSVLTRTCWCSKCPATCPVHFLGAFFAGLGGGQRPFARFTPSVALCQLRMLLNWMQVPQAKYYRSHDLRRGHARDMQANGSTLRDILNAGEWRSPAFLQYLDLEQLEDDCVVEAHLAESSGEEEEDQ